MLPTTNRTLAVILALFMLTTLLPMAVLADTEPNDDLASAETIQTGKLYSGTLSSTDTKDYYKVHIESGKKVTITFTAKSTSSMYLWFAAPDGTEINEIDSQGGIASTLGYALASETPAGDYYLLAYYTIGDYSFEVNVTDQNDAGSGRDVGPDILSAYVVSAGTVYSGEIMDEDSVDFYKVWVGSGKIITAHFTSNSTSTMYCWVGDTDGNEAFEMDSMGGIRTDQTYYTANETVAGYWYLKVYYTDGGYTFSVDLSDQNDALSGHDVAGDMTHAYIVRANKECSGILEDLDSTDYYKVHVMQNATIGVSITSGSSIEMYLWLGDTAGNEMFEVSSKGNIMGTQTATEPAESTGYYFVKVYFTSGSYKFKVTTTGGLPDTEGARPYTANATVDGSSIHVEADVDVMVSDVAPGYVDQVFNGSLDAALEDMGLEDMGVMFQIDPETAEAATDVHIEVYVKDDVPKDADPSSIKLYWLDEKNATWVVVGSSTYDSASGRLTANIDHLTVFAAYAKEGSSDSGGSAGPSSMWWIGIILVLVIVLIVILVIVIVIVKNRKKTAEVRIGPFEKDGKPLKGRVVLGVDGKEYSGELDQTGTAFIAKVPKGLMGKKAKAKAELDGTAGAEFEVTIDNNATIPVPQDAMAEKPAPQTKAVKPSDEKVPETNAPKPPDAVSAPKADAPPPPPPD